MVRWHSSNTNTQQPSVHQSTLSILVYRAMNLVVLCGSLRRRCSISRLLDNQTNQIRIRVAHLCHQSPIEMVRSSSVSHDGFIEWRSGDEFKNNFHFHWYYLSTLARFHLNHRHSLLEWKVSIRSIWPIILQRNNSIHPFLRLRRMGPNLMIYCRLHRIVNP